MKISDIKKEYGNYNLYLVIDSAQNSEELIKFLKIIKLNSFLEIYSLFANTKENNLPWEVVPLLLDLNEMTNEDALNFIEFWWVEKNILQVLAVNKDYPLKLLINKLQKLMIFEMNDSRRFMFRWFDPRVMQNIEYLLNEEDLKSIYKGIFMWGVQYIDPNSGIKKIKNLVVDYVCN